jgi:transcriptional regulator of NAD metabolism
MEAELRREQILNMIKRHESPVSASLLAKSLNVSRQVVVGDVALLRARGQEIVATARGYVIPEFMGANQYTGKAACCHAPEDVKTELYTIVDSGAVVVNVIVEHNIYGEITGSLNLASRNDVDNFVKKVDMSEIRLLCELTSGIHLHTIACRDRAHFEQVCGALDECGFLFQN